MRESRRTGRFGIATFALAITGCAFVSRGELVESRKRIAALQAEVALLKDANARLSSNRADLNQRAGDDARRIAELEEATSRLENELTAARAEREQTARAFERFKRRIQAAAVR